jgi:hypothetical protein
MDRYEFPEEYAPARSWTDLHDVCDANEYLIAADEKFGIEFHPACNTQITLRNEAIALAEAVLFARA